MSARLQMFLFKLILFCGIGLVVLSVALILILFEIFVKGIV